MCRLQRLIDVLFPEILAFLGVLLLQVTLEELARSYPLPL